MILYNGGTGSLGAYFAPALAAKGRPGALLRARLESPLELRAELEALPSAFTAGARLTLVHMAAKVSVPECEREPEQAQQTNVVDAAATVRTVCAWAREQRLQPAVIYVGTGHVYAKQATGSRLDESAATAPRSVYAHTKLLGEQAVAGVCAELGADLLVARVFGLVAPRQPPHYVLPGLVRRVREDRLGDVPGLSFVRDYLDSRDVCDALIELAESAVFPSGVVNLCSGAAVSLRELLTLIVHALRPAEAESVLARLGEAAARADDVPWLVGDPGRVSELLGRSPRRIPLSRTAQDALA